MRNARRMPRAGWRRSALLIGLLTWPLGAIAQLALKRTEHEMVVSSHAPPPTWRKVIAVSEQASAMNSNE